MTKFHPLTESGSIYAVLGLFLESETTIQDAAATLGVERNLIQSNRIHFLDELVQDDRLGDVSDLEIVGQDLPEGVSELNLSLESWEPLYLDGDGLEILGIFCRGRCVSTVNVPVEAHSPECPGLDGPCIDDCTFNDVWWEMNAKMWQEFEVRLSHKGKPGVRFTGWLLSPPEITGN